MAVAYIALGSNLALPVQQIKAALKVLQTLPKSKLIQHSSLYQTAPMGYDDSQLKAVPDFINAVAQLETTLAPLALMQHLLSIEDAFGRARPFPNAPRILDLDLLLYDQATMQSDVLTLPHPRMHLRGFVMLPLAEIAPELILLNGRSVVELALQYQQQGIQKLSRH